MAKEPQATRVILVRHAPTAENARHILIGRTDPPLSTHGRKLARRVAKALAGAPIVAICSSPRLRAQQTASAIARRLAVHEVLTDERFAEIDLGVVDGMPVWEAYERYQPWFEASFIEDERDFAFPGGETWSHAADRFLRGLTEAAMNYATQTICVVTHGAVLGLFHACLCRLPFARFRSYQPHHASISELVLRATDGTWEIVRWNDTHHLSDPS
ncbi:putative phosphoglycerate mutase [Alicyclobacillus sacchari]|uniref:Putative phosphoglycerate mutase n=1 Tax=Alicyclobacillus sacchari TaxID=392010 RepID=A0A4V3HEI6_9BACL|nr:histidine phosphatase family protein [Alicyclobacillus sacchari]TDY47959.1 putative phosphoglycerate mutase [Alicyclobacillus sacchari]GMA56077.1 fructose 2,6-bisphosphatase [Alicyclobacillus sacchari]